MTAFLCTEHFHFHRTAAVCWVSADESGEWTKVKVVGPKSKNNEVKDAENLLRVDSWFSVRLSLQATQI